MPLNTQIQILSVDTGNFYYDDETALHERNRIVRTERRKLINGYNEELDDGTKIHHLGTKEIISQLKERGFVYNEKEINSFCKQYYDNDLFFNKYGEEIHAIVGNDEDVRQLIVNYYNNMKQIHEYVAEAKDTKNQLLKLLQSRVDFNISQDEGHRKIRELRKSTLLDSNGNIKDKNIISVFESAFTRMIKAVPDKLCEDFMVVQVYYFDIIKDLIYHGFTYNGEKYIYFTSSAGQIRTKKTVFVKESVWKKYEKTLMCGLTVDIINEKGGINQNKYLSYIALSNSATDVWEEFDIDKTIVIDDFETLVFGTYDFVDDKDYSITRMSDFVPITHTDGAGMMLPNAFGVTQKNMMIRLPFVKGLLGVFDFVKFIQVNNCSPIVKDIYGVEHDVIEEDIQIIFTKSQFKLWKYFDSWSDYKEKFKKYDCSAGFTNVEENRIENSTINYQMLQSLTNITDEEILEIAGASIDKLNNICSSVKDIQNAFGATIYNTNKTALQKAILLYPELLNDVYIRNRLKDIKDSLIKRYKSGKLQVFGKYTFILPDFYAACQYWFQHIERPDGLLADGEVFCWLFRKSDKLDCLRSPHLYREHAIKKNIAYSGYCDRQLQVREWFQTDALYTSSFDLISKVLQFDVDGDKSLVIGDKKFVEIAERNMNGIVPLYYNMKKALPSVLNSETIYNGLVAAFTGGNIGMYSNSISKIWNNDVFVVGTDEEKQEALNCIKCLCAQNNFVID